MRQPEVAARLGLLVLAVVLAVPVVAAISSAVVAGAFLAEFLTAGRCRVLSRLTAEPIAAASDGGERAVFRPAATWRRRPLVLVHGYAPAGSADPRLVDSARLLARAGFEVTVPSIPGLTRGRLRPQDMAPVVAALALAPAPAVVVGVSIGAAPAVLAAADPAVRTRVRALLLLGGYGSARELLRFWLTGDYAFGAERGRTVHDPALVAAFLDANAELADEALRRALAARDPRQIDAGLAALPPETRWLLDQLSPERIVPSLTAPIVLVHGRDDPAVPYTESLRLAAARPHGTRVVLVGVLQHVEVNGAGAPFTALLDVVRLWSAIHALRQAG